MALPKFHYVAPRDLKEVYAALEEFRGRSAVLAGGTELLMHLKQRLKNPACLVALKNVSEMRSLGRNDDEGFDVGASCSLRSLAESPEVQSSLPALAQAAESVASPQIRNAATIGGNICQDARCWYFNRSKSWRLSIPACYKLGGEQCHVVKGGKRCYALYQADTVPSLLVYKAQLKLGSASGERLLPLEALYSGRGETPNLLAPGEVVTRIMVPRPGSGSGSVYLKYRQRGTMQFPVLGIAALVRLDKAQKGCEAVRFGITAHDSKPLLLEAAELLKGLDEPLLSEDLLKQLLAEARVVTHMGVSASLKRRMLRVHVHQAFQAAWKAARQDN